MRIVLLIALTLTMSAPLQAESEVEFYERRIRPLLVKRCYECHSEEANEREGGLLLDRKSGWLAGGDTGKAVTPGDADASLLIEAVRYSNDDLQMPPEAKLSEAEIGLLEKWVKLGAPGGKTDMGETEFSQLGNQDALFALAKGHWAFQPIVAKSPPEIGNETWSNNKIDRFVFNEMAKHELTPSPRASAQVLLRRLSFDLRGLPPSPAEVQAFETAWKANPEAAVESTVDRFLKTKEFGEHFARMWLDVARYADTDSAYRADTKTPHYFPFAFTFRDYVIDSFNADKPIDQFMREQLAADLMGFSAQAPELAATGFLTVGPHANSNPTESVDDLIDTTSRGLLGLSVACARCHNHKYEPIPTTDYYALHGVFSSITRMKPLNEEKLPLISGYEQSPADIADYEQKRAAIDKKIKDAGNSKAKGNNRSVAEKIIETELAELLAFHPGAPVRSMVVREKPKPIQPFVYIRGERRNRGEAVQRRFLSVLDESQQPFPPENSGRLQLAKRITDPANPLTSRVFVNRVWGRLIGSHLVATPSDFGLQSSPPTHPALLDTLAADFMTEDWSLKKLVRQIVLSQTYQQQSVAREAMAKIDSDNRYLWRANRKHLSIEALRDSMLAVSGQLDFTSRGRPAPLWGDDFTKRRTIFGFVNRFNLDPTLRAFDFPSPMQTGAVRGESVVAPQSLFALNSPFVIQAAKACVQREGFAKRQSDEERATFLFEHIYQRTPQQAEVDRIQVFLKQQEKFAGGQRFGAPWQLVAQAMLMSNEFQYID